MLDKYYSIIITGLLVGGCVATNLPREQATAVVLPAKAPVVRTVTVTPPSEFGATYDAAIIAGNNHTQAMAFRKLCYIALAKGDDRLCANAAWTPDRKAQHISNMIKASQIYLQSNDN